jgi:3beta-hydroxysteroid-4beta-carboxylate 3-dehydrogenase (decarboxylating)
MVELVTGATGHLGANLVRQLLAEGRHVRVLLRQNDTAVDGLEVERCFGDLRDAAAASRAVSGCERVYHCAARVSTSRRGARETYACNVVGTRKTAQSAQESSSPRAERAP